MIMYITEPWEIGPSVDIKQSTLVIKKSKIQKSSSSETLYLSVAHRFTGSMVQRLT